MRSLHLLKYEFVYHRFDSINFLIHVLILALNVISDEY